jgi:hypothetical protein
MTATIVSGEQVNVLNGKPSVLCKRLDATFTNKTGFLIPLPAVAVAASAQIHAVFQQSLGGGSDERSAPWRINDHNQRTHFPWYDKNYYDNFMLTNRASIPTGADYIPGLRVVSATRNAASLYSIYEGGTLVGSSTGSSTNAPTNAAFPDAYAGWASISELVFFNAMTTVPVFNTVNGIMKSYHGIS